MLKDERIWRDPKLFKPERFLTDKDVTDPSTLAFGFGRRYAHIPILHIECWLTYTFLSIRFCPGKQLATDVVYMTMLYIAWAFDIQPAEGELRSPPEAARFVDNGIKCVYVSYIRRFENMH